MTHFSHQPYISYNSTPYLHFAPLSILENLPLTPHTAHPPLWAIYQFTLLNMYKYLPLTSLCTPFLTCARGGRPPLPHRYAIGRPMSALLVITIYKVCF